jgi:hypothetical protein
MISKTGIVGSRVPVIKEYSEEYSDVFVLSRCNTTGGSTCPVFSLVPGVCGRTDR